MKVLEKHPYAFLILLLVAAFCCYYPVLHNEVLTYDDPGWTAHYAKGITTFFTRTVHNMYAPVTLASFAFDHATGTSYHLTNLLLHLLNTGLAFVFLKQLTRSTLTAFFGSALFAFHPMGTDTVAWISARSNLLYTLFFLAALVSYLRAQENRKLHFYVLSLISFILACLSKSAALSLPFVLLLIDYMHGRKIHFKNLLQKMPFFLVAIGAAILTIKFRADAGAAHTVIQYSLIEKVFLLTYSWDFYLIKLLLPLDLSALYTAPEKMNLLHYLSPLLPLLFIYLVTRAGAHKKELIAGFGFFILTVTPPLLGFLEDGFTANRYTYLPYVGLFFLMASAISWLPEGKKFTTALMLLFLSGCALLSFERTQVWKNDHTLMSDVLNKQPDNAFAYNSRGVWNYYKGNTSDALFDYTNAIRCNSRYAEAYYNRGIVFHDVNDADRAIEDYTHALELNPSSANAHLARGITYMDKKNDLQSAMADFDRALGIDVNFAQAYYNRGLVWLKLGRADMACSDFSNVRALGFRQGDEIMREYCE